MRTKSFVHRIFKNSYHYHNLSYTSHILLLYKSLKDKSIKDSLPGMDFSDIKQEAGKVKLDKSATVNAQLLSTLQNLG